jgi:hypothetical protein
MKKWLAILMIILAGVSFSKGKIKEDRYNVNQYYAYYIENSNGITRYINFNSRKYLKEHPDDEAFLGYWFNYIGLTGLTTSCIENASTILTNDDPKAQPVQFTAFIIGKNDKLYYCGVLADKRDLKGNETIAMYKANLKAIINSENFPYPDLKTKAIAIVGYNIKVTKNGEITEYDMDDTTYYQEIGKYTGRILGQEVIEFAGQIFY